MKLKISFCRSVSSSMVAPGDRGYRLSVLLNSRCPSTFWPRRPRKRCHDARLDAMRLARPRRSRCCSSACTRGAAQRLVRQRRALRYRVAALDPAQWKPRAASPTTTRLGRGRRPADGDERDLQDYGDAPLDVLTTPPADGLHRRRLQIDRKRFRSTAATRSRRPTPRKPRRRAHRHHARGAEEGRLRLRLHLRRAAGQGPEHRAAFDRLLDEFTTTSGRRPGARRS